MYIEKIIIRIGNKISNTQPVLDIASIDIRPTRVLCAVDNISNKMGIAIIKPEKHAIIQIFPVIICICFAIKLSLAPI